MRRPRVLVADDSALARAVILHGLEAEGYDVAETADGEGAIAAALLALPDVILLDVEMPGLDGHATLRRLRDHPELADIPVLFVTGRTDPADVAEGLRLGAHDYLRKPFEPIELVARVRAAVRTGLLQEALRERNAELERIASVDALTGLFNRRFLEEQATRSIGRLRRHGGTMAVSIFDVDAFKAVNDTHGHEVGDAVLVAVARRLLEGTRAEDLLGRWGGEEFVVLAPDTDSPGVAGLAERMRLAVSREPVRVAGLALDVTISAGWAAGPGGLALDALVRAADRALYAAKADGRNRVRGEELTAG